MSLESVKNTAMQLSGDEKAELIDALWDDLELEDARKKLPAWKREIEERIDAVDSGRLATLDGDAALEELRKTIKR